MLSQPGVNHRVALSNVGAATPMHIFTQVILSLIGHGRITTFIMLRSHRCNNRCSRPASSRSSLLVRAGGKVFADPVHKEIAAFAPATVANLGPGFDWMGCAVGVSHCCMIALALQLHQTMWRRGTECCMMGGMGWSPA